MAAVDLQLFCWPMKRLRKLILIPKDVHLASNTYVVGHSVALTVIIMNTGFSLFMIKSFTSDLTMVNLPNFFKRIVVGKQTEKNCSYRSLRQRTLSICCPLGFGSCMIKGDSIWFCSCICNNVKTISIITLTRLGFLQRMDLARKHVL
ncbi:hypothetical protein C5167_012867 [Papaver somniferum]|uniref:Uncharacterized protein n=1 Tax=Papaver somniferum TaxID=3469 RepID=A0A4Y7IYP8_PAPSO|nr:hypothetical protein C5167_012867 [Papaver somniferum]